MNSEDLRILAEANQLDMIMVENSPVDRVVWCRAPLGDDWFFDSGYGFWGAVWNKYFAKILKMSCEELINPKYETIYRDDLDCLPWQGLVANPLILPKSQVSRFHFMSPWLHAAYVPDLSYCLSDFIFVDVNLSSISAFEVSFQVQVQHTTWKFQLSDGILLDSCGESKLYAFPWLSNLFEDKPTTSDVKHYLRRLLKWIDKRKDSTIQPIPATVVMFESESGLIDLSKGQFPKEAEILSQVFCGSGDFEKAYKFLNLEHSQTWQKWS